MGRASLDIVKISEISVEDLSALGREIVLVDVREPEEWAVGHLAYAVHIPLGSVAGRLDDFNGRPTYVICRSGGRSNQACEFVANRGGEVVNVAGGMMAWEKAGLEMEVGTSGG